jgi:hypothetical protein
LSTPRASRSDRFVIAAVELVAAGDQDVDLRLRHNQPDQPLASPAPLEAYRVDVKIFGRPRCPADMPLLADATTSKA